MKHFYLLLLAFLCFAPAFAGQPKHIEKKADKREPPAVLKVDSASVVDVRTFNADSLKKFSKQPEFDYREQELSLDTSWWTRFWRWFWHLFVGKKQTDGKASDFWVVFFKVIEYTLVGMGVAAIIFVILKIAGVDISRIFGKKSTAINLPYSEYLEDINSIDFDKEIDAAINQHNYRLAVRLLYLKCLKKLSDAGQIDWQISKTNTSYVNEIADIEKRGVFSALTRRFEYVWYGEFNINSQAYADIQAEFNHFNSNIK